MKKTIVISFLSVILVSSAYAENLTYGSYRILSNQKYIHQGKNITTTYVIASNPDIAIVIQPPDAGTVKRIQSGSLKNCEEITGEYYDNFISRVNASNVAASQMQVASRMGGGAITGNERQIYDYMKNLVVFESEARGMPLYHCEKITKK